MSFKKCLLDNVESGIITKEQGEKLFEDFSEASKSQDVGTAWNRMFQKKANENQAFAKSLALHTKKVKELSTELEALPTVKEKKAFLYQKTVNAAPLAKVKNENFNRILNEGFEENGILANNIDDFEAAVMATIDGVKSTSKTVDKISKNLQDAFHYGKSDAKRLGVIFGDLGKKYFPQSYDRNKVASLSEKEFVDLMLEHVDLRGESTEKMSLILREAKKQIDTDGLHVSNLEGAAGVIEKRNLSRELHFKNGNSYLKVMKQIGSEGGDTRKIMEKYFFGLSQDLALSDELGPLSRDLIKSLGKKVNEGGDPDRSLLAAYNIVANTAFNGNKDSWLYKAHGSFQLWQRASHLGGASVSALSDTVFNASVHRMNGGSFFKPLGDYMKLVTQVGKKDLLELNKKMGYYTEVFAGNLLEENRFSVGGDGSGIVKKISDATFSFSGLNYVTKMGKIIGQMNANHIIADNIKAGKSWGKLDFVLKERLQKAGFNESKWKMALKETNVVSDGRMNYFNTAELRTKGAPGTDVSKLADELDLFTVQMAELVTNENNISVRSLTSGALLDSSGKASVGQKVLAETVFQYKNFPMSAYLNHFAPGARRFKRGLETMVKDGEISEGLKLMSELGYLMLTTTMMGVAVKQIKNPMKGKSFQELDTKLVVAGMAQGGGAGIFGDFLFQDTSRFGNSLPATLLGPSVSLAEDVIKTYKGNSLDKVMGGDEADFHKMARGTAKLLRRNTPILSSLWYTRLIAERMIFDSIDNMVDPKNFKKTIRRNNKMMGKVGQEYWWEPNKAPDASKFPVPLKEQLKDI